MVVSFVLSTVVAVMLGSVQVRSDGCPANISGYEQDVDYKGDDLETPIAVKTAQVRFARPR